MFCLEISAVSIKCFFTIRLLHSPNYASLCAFVALCMTDSPLNILTELLNLSVSLIHLCWLALAAADLADLPPDLHGFH